MTSTEIIWAIQSKRMTLGLSRRTLSLRSGVNEKTIEKIEQVTERKTMNNLIALCNAMGLEIIIKENGQ